MKNSFLGKRPLFLRIALEIITLLVLGVVVCTSSTLGNSANLPQAGGPIASTEALVLQHGNSPDASYTGTTDVVVTNLWQANTQLGGWEALDTYRDDQERHRILIRFDLSPLPSGAQVQSASLSLYHLDSEFDDASQTVSAFRLISAWTEGTGVESFPTPGYVPDGATYTLAAPGTSWATPGGNFDPAVIAATIVPAFTAAGWVDWDLTGLVSQWASGVVPNYGVILRTGGSSFIGHRFYSRNYEGDNALRPRLTIVYTLDGASSTPTVSPTATVSTQGSPDQYLPLVLKQYPLGPTATATVTLTPTGSTPTPTLTPTPDGTGTPLTNYITFNRGLDLSEIIGSIQVSTGSSIWIVDPDNPAGTLTRVTPDELASSLMPSWGPGKARIVFASTRENAGDTPLLDIWTINPDGSNLQRLTQGAGHNWTPAWSPDGNYIAYSSTRRAPGGEEDTVSFLDIFIMDSDGSNQRFLADMGAQDEDPVFSADSQTIYFVAERPACYQLWQVPAAGGAAGPLLDDQSNAICGEDPSLSPDGSTLFFWANQLGQFAGVNLTTGAVTGYAWGINEPWIGPDGIRFTYIQNGNVYIANLDGSGATSITQTGDVFFPRWAAP